MIVSEHYGTDRWQLAPLLGGDWADLDRENADLVVSRLAEAIPAGTAEPKVEALRLTPLDFYRGWMLCEMQIAAAEEAPEHEVEPAAESPASPRPVIRSYLYGPDGFTPLDGLSFRIHEHNMLHGIDISTAELCKAYLRFFCFFVRGEAGPFELHEDGGLLDLAALADGDTRATVTSSLRPIEEVESARQPGQMAFRGCVHYGEHLFESTFLIAAHGLVEMVSDDLLVEGVRRLPPLQFEGNAHFIAVT